jgi:hypothetical protein
LVLQISRAAGGLAFVPSEARSFAREGPTRRGVDGYVQGALSSKQAGIASQQGLTLKEQNRNIAAAFSQGKHAMSNPSALTETSRYEQACDQAIAMCDGNLRSTIKALIMANEYLEAELEELQAAIAAGCAPADAPRASSNAA